MAANPNKPPLAAAADSSTTKPSPTAKSNAGAEPIISPYRGDAPPGSTPLTDRARAIQQRQWSARADAIENTPGGQRYVAQKPAVSVPTAPLTQAAAPATTPAPAQGAQQAQQQAQTSGNAQGQAVDVDNKVQLFSPILGIIRSGEGDYNAVNHGRAGDWTKGRPEISKMTLGEWKAMQARHKNWFATPEQTRGEAPADSAFAMGAYQFIPETLGLAADAAGITDDTVMTPDVQDRLAVALVMNSNKRESMRDYINGTSNDLEAAADDFAAEWASVAADDEGNTRYNKGGNKASISRDEAKAALLQARNAWRTGKPTPFAVSIKPSSAAADATNVANGAGSAIGALAGGDLSRLGIGSVAPKSLPYTQAQINTISGRLDESPEDKARRIALEGDPDAAPGTPANLGIYRQEEQAYQSKLGTGAGEYIDKVKNDPKFMALLPERTHAVSPGAAVMAQAMASFGSALSGNQAYDQGMRQQLAQLEQQAHEDKLRENQTIMQEAMNRRVEVLQFTAAHLQRTFEELQRLKQSAAAAKVAVMQQKNALEIANATAAREAALQASRNSTELIKTMVAAGYAVGADGKFVSVSGKSKGEQGLVGKREDYEKARNNIMTAIVELGAQKKPDPITMRQLTTSYIQNEAQLLENETVSDMLDRVQAAEPIIEARLGVSPQEARALVNGIIKTSINSALLRSVEAKREVSPGVADYGWQLGLINADTYTALTGRKPGEKAPPTPPPGEKPSPQDEAKNQRFAAIAEAKDAYNKAKAAAMETEDRGTVEAGGETTDMRNARVAQSMLEQGPPRPKHSQVDTYFATLTTRIENLKAELEYYRTLDQLGFADPQHDVNKLLADYGKALKERDAYHRESQQQAMRENNYPL